MLSSGRSAIVVTSWRGHASAVELALRAAAGERARDAYVELARVLDADVFDNEYMETRATPVARALARRFGMFPGQVVEMFLRRNRYRHLVAWADRLGLPLALMLKLVRARRDLVLISVWLSRPQKAFFLKPLGVHSHLQAIINYGSVQMEIAADRLGVPREKLYLALQPVDEQFWQPTDDPPENSIVSVGWEARDYSTLVEAVEGLDLDVELAVGSSVFASSGEGTGSTDEVMRKIFADGPPPRVRIQTDLAQAELRRLYSRCRFVVVPLHDVDYDAGVTVLTEAMAMGKAVVVTRTRGQIDLIRDGEEGIYVPPGDTPGLRKAITFLLENPEEAERMGRAGRTRAEERHSLDSYVARLAAIVRGEVTESDAQARIRQLSSSTSSA